MQPDTSTISAWERLFGLFIRTLCTKPMIIEGSSRTMIVLTQTNVPFDSIYPTYWSLILIFNPKLKF